MPQPPHRSREYATPSHQSWNDPSVTDFVGPGRVSLVVVVAALAAVATVVGLHFGLPAGGAGLVQVPSVVGMTQTQARLAADSAGFNLQVLGTTSDAQVAPGAVAKQVPLGGETAARGTTLAVTMSDGPGAVTVPPLAGMSLPQAIERLVSLGLRVGATRREAREGVPAGQVVGTDPAQGASLKLGARVGLVLSQGSQAPSAAPAGPAPSSPPPSALPLSAPGAGRGQVVVPKVIGVRLPFATSRLTSVGLTMGRVRYEQDEDHIDGYVLRQSPSAGSSVSRGTAVDVTVNRTE